MISPRLLSPSPTNDVQASQSIGGSESSGLALDSGKSSYAQDDEESCPDELDARLAVRWYLGASLPTFRSPQHLVAGPQAGASLRTRRGSIAAFLQRMRQEEMAGIMVPTIQLLLWPVGS